MKIMRLKGVMAQTGLGRSSIYKFMSEGAFPESISLGARSVGWLEQDVEDWIKGRIAARKKKDIHCLGLGMIGDDWG